MARMARTGSSAVALLARRGAAWVAGGVLLLLVVAPSARATDAPDLTVTKSSDAVGALHAGDTLRYTVTVTNNGTATAHDVELGDDLPVGLLPRTILPVFPGGSCTVAGSQGGSGPPHYSVFCARDTLSAGASAATSFEVKLTHAVSCGTLVNIAHAAASDEPASARGNNNGSVSDTVSCPPSISIDKHVPTYAHVGDEVAVSMVVTNRGSIDLHGVRVTDAGCSGAITLVADGDGDPTLAPGETWRYGCRQRVTHSAGQHLTTTAVVTAASVDGRARASDRASLRVLRPGLTLRVTSDPISGSPGDTITYRFVLHNTGDATLTDISVHDDQLGDVGQVSQLVPGHSVALTVERLVGARHVWVIDRAKATGADPSGHAVTATGSAAVTLVAPNAGGPASGGDGTAFTGAPIAAPLSAGIMLALLGVGALLVERRRRV